MFPVASVTTNHKLDGLKTTEIIYLTIQEAGI